MKTTGAMLAGLLLVACGADGGVSKPGTDFTCDPKTQRFGTYLQHYTEHSGGTCGPVSDSLVRWTPDGAQDPNTTCLRTAPATVTDSGCTVQNSVECTGTSGDNASVIGTTTQQDPSGTRITGLFDMTLRNAAGAVTCESLYDVTYTRQ